MFGQSYVLDARAANDHFPGIGRYVSNLARAIAAQLNPGERLHLIHDPSQPGRWQLPAGRRNVNLWPMSVSHFSTKQQWAVPKLLRRLEATLYHSPYYLMPYRPRTPTLLTVYDLIPNIYPRTVSWRARLFFSVSTRLALRSAAHVIAISEATKSDLIRFYRVSERKVATIPLAADPRFRPQADSEINRVRMRCQLPEKYVLYLGINKPHKNLVRLVEAWGLVARHFQDAPTLAIAGEWDERYPEAKQLANKMDSECPALFVGPVPDADLPGLFSGASLFVFPSLYEGFGLPVLEAMACGTPVACSSSSSLPEVAGNAAVFFDPASSESIAETLLQLLADDDRLFAMKREGIERAARFSWDNTAARTLDLYRNLSKGAA